MTGEDGKFPDSKNVVIHTLVWGSVGRFWAWVGDGVLVVSAGEAVGAPDSGDVWTID